MIEYQKKILTAQFEASFCMLNDCVQKCPPAHWQDKIAYYPFWQVAYHTLSYSDYYLSPNEESFKPRDFHPPQNAGDLFNDEPVRPGGFTKEEITAYLTVCRQKAKDAFASETLDSLPRDSGFRGRPFSRGELHLYNLRHMQHHTGQLSAHLRRIDPAIDPSWIGTGWR